MTNSNKKMKDLTTILVSKKTRLKLKKQGKKGETYNDIVLRLIDLAGGKGKK